MSVNGWISEGDEFSCLTIGMELLIGQLRWCKPMSKWLSTIDVGVQSEQLLTWQRWISQHAIHTMGTRSICVKIKNAFYNQLFFPSPPLSFSLKLLPSLSSLLWRPPLLGPLRLPPSCSCSCCCCCCCCCRRAIFFILSHKIKHCEFSLYVIV